MNVVIVSEMFPTPKPILNGKSKAFLNLPNDASSDEDDNGKRSLLEA
jgi:hypothetical protein